MIEMILTSSVLILIILMLRHFIGGKISMRLRYALWLLAAVRLIMPINVGSSSTSVLNLLPVMARHSEENILADRISGEENEKEHTNGIVPAEPESVRNQSTAEPETMGEQSAAVPEDTFGQNSALSEKGLVDYGNAWANVPEKNEPHNLSNIWRNVLVVIWFAGIVLMGSYITLTQLRFVRYLHRNREAVSVKAVSKEWEKRLSEHGMQLYQVQGLPSPCLVGRNIYIDRKLCRETDRLPHILAHEYCHARQHDTLWALLRSVLTAVYWFHPLVWAAAYGAKQDSELACDEAAVALLGENSRYEYGRTLLYLLEGGSNKIGYAGMILTMDGRKSGIRERVSMLAGRHRSSKRAAAAVAVIMCIACGCAFTGAKDAKQPENSREAEDISSYEEAIKRLSEENAVLEKEKGQLAEALEETQKQLSEAKELEVTETSQEEQRAEQLKAKAKKDEAFQRTFRNTDIQTIMQNKEIDQQAYGEYYLGYTKECPLENDTWYILLNDTSGIALYGLYTEEYGCYGIATLIDGDMNFFLEEWLPSIRINNIDVLEWAEDGLPRMFAFCMPQTSTGTSDISRLYVADRYDTGQIELYSFAESDYRKQFEDKMDFTILQDSGKITVGWENDMEVGEIDVSAFADYVIEDVVWEGDPLGFQWDDAFPVGDINAQAEASVKQKDTKEPIRMVTGIGLKLQGIDELWYYRLPPLVFPVDTGEWGEHAMTLGIPSVEYSSFITKKQQTDLPDVVKKLDETAIHQMRTED